MRKAWRPSHEPGRRHRPQGTPIVFRFTGRLRGCFRLSPPDRPALVPGHRDRQQPQHATAARAGEPAGAEPQRIRLPARVLQHGRHPAPGVPILTMRLFAEEKKLKTMELLVTSPVTITDIVVGKFVAALTVFAGMLALTALG